MHLLLYVINYTFGKLAGKIILIQVGIIGCYK